MNTNDIENKSVESSSFSHTTFCSVDYTEELVTEIQFRKGTKGEQTYFPTCRKYCFKSICFQLLNELLLHGNAHILVTAQLPTLPFLSFLPVFCEPLFIPSAVRRRRRYHHRCLVMPLDIPISYSRAFLLPLSQRLFVNHLIHRIYPIKYDYKEEMRGRR